MFKCITKHPLGLQPESTLIHLPSTVSCHHHAQKLNVHHLLDEMPKRDISSCNSILASMVRTSNFSNAWNLFLNLHRLHNDLDAYTFTPILTACSGLLHPRCGEQVHGLMVKTGSDSGTISKTAIMDMYSKNGNLVSTLKLFEELESRDVVCWNALMSSFLREGLAKEAIRVFQSMRRENVDFSEFTLCSVIKACILLKAFNQGKQVHGLVIVRGQDLVVLATALIDFYSSFGKVEEAMEIYSCHSQGSGDQVLHNSMIAGCINNRKYKEAFLAMSLMKPNVIALTSVLAACSENSDLWIGKQIHCVATRFGFTYDTQLCNALLDMYAKCGRISNAKTVFDLCEKNTVTWTTMIDAYGIHGYGSEAFALFNMIGEYGNELLPNSVTLLAVLSACGHSGLVDQGRECFRLAGEKYGLDAGPQHYACFIDSLGRAGRIDDAWCVFHEMVEKEWRPSAAVWAALLNACSLNKDLDRGEYAAKCLMELEPENPGNHILLSNFYAALDRWDSVGELRTNMRKKGLVKETGNSWVTAV